MKTNLLYIILMMAFFWLCAFGCSPNTASMNAVYQPSLPKGNKYKIDCPQVYSKQLKRPQQLWSK